MYHNYYLCIEYVVLLFSFQMFEFLAYYFKDIFRLFFLFDSAKIVLVNTLKTYQWRLTWACRLGYNPKAKWIFFLSDIALILFMKFILYSSCVLQNILKLGVDNKTKRIYISLPSFCGRDILQWVDHHILMIKHC